ncbi:hypothetical protein F0562_004486 [Nyssa sinensis]|uniref:Uncharacterized protein n=1 Tax=Nyssa sinensis TaxID=561372 RepID=A0A5J5BYI4_9ASTE|nr:hypothetical protein F0562_004486 [Nyssa sinensis]
MISWSCPSSKSEHWLLGVMMKLYKCGFTTGFHSHFPYPWGWPLQLIKIIAVTVKEMSNNSTKQKNLPIFEGVSV